MDEREVYGHSSSMAAALAIIALLCLMLLFSCSSTKKTTTTVSRSTDSSSSFHSITKADTAAKQTDIHAQDIDFTVVYGTDSAPIQTKTISSAEYKEATKAGGAPPSVLDFLPDHSRIRSISGHIGSISDSSSSMSTVRYADTSHRQDVKAQQVNQVVVETKTSIRWYIYAGIGLLVLILIIIIALKIAKKL